LFLFLAFYGRFLSIKMVNRPTTMIATNRPTVAGTKYMSAIDSGGASVGAGVAGAGSTLNAVVACDGQYDSLPPNDA
jgi:hypothetical protein